MLRGFSGCVGACTWVAPIRDLFLATQVSVELVFEVVYVELEFFMLADLVV
jgi:hypothetical protein